MYMYISQMYICSVQYIHTYIHTYIHSTCFCWLYLVQRGKQAKLNNVHKCMHTYTSAHVYIYIYIYIRIYMCVYTYTYASYMRVCSFQSHTRMYITHTCLQHRAHIHTCTHTCMPSLPAYNSREENQSRSIITVDSLHCNDFLTATHTHSRCHKFAGVMCLYQQEWNN